MAQNVGTLPGVAAHHLGPGAAGVLLAAADAKRGERLGQHVDVVAHAHAYPLVQVGHLRQPGVVQAHVLVDLAAQQRRGVAQGVALVEEVAQPLVAAAVGLVEDGVVLVRGVVEGLALLVDEAGPAEDGADLRVVLQEVDLAPQLAGQEQVVGIEHGDVAAPRAAQGVVHGQAGAAVLRKGVQVDAGVAQGGDVLGGGVGGAVVGDEDFQVVDALAQRAAQAVLHEGGVVVAGHHHADQGRARAAPQKLGKQ